MKTVGKFAITYDPLVAEYPERWDMAKFKDGTHLVGAAIIPFLTHDVIIYDHWPTTVMMKTLRANRPKARHLLYCSQDAVPEVEPWVACSSEQRFINNILRQFRLRGTNGQFVNIWEGHATRAPVHSVNLGSLVTNTNHGVELQRLRATIGNDGWFLDSMSDDAYYGTATNAPPREDRRQHWGTLVKQIHEADYDADVWGNTGGPQWIGKWGLDTVYFEFENRALSRFDEYKVTAWTGQHLILDR